MPASPHKPPTLPTLLGTGWLRRRGRRAQADGSDSRAGGAAAAPPPAVQDHWCEAAQGGERSRLEKTLWPSQQQHRLALTGPCGGWAPSLLPHLGRPCSAMPCPAPSPSPGCSEPRPSLLPPPLPLCRVSCCTALPAPARPSLLGGWGCSVSAARADCLGFSLQRAAAAGGFGRKMRMLLRAAPRHFPCRWPAASEAVLPKKARCAPRPTHHPILINTNHHLLPLQGCGQRDRRLLLPHQRPRDHVQAGRCTAAPCGESGRVGAVETERRRWTAPKSCPSWQVAQQSSGIPQSQLPSTSLQQRCPSAGCVLLRRFTDARLVYNPLGAPGR